MNMIRAGTFLLLVDIVICTDVVGKGYNLVLGNPDGVNPISGGPDPGILDRQIIENDQLTQQYGRFSQYCKEKSDVTWFYGDKAYTDKLLGSIKVSGDGNYMVERKAFMSSSQRIYMEDHVFSNYLIVQEFQKICVYDSFRQPLYNRYSGQYNSVTDEFAAAVCSLSPTYDKNEYIEFIEKWGTHVVLAAEVGTKEIRRYQISDIALFEHIQDQIPEAIFTTADMKEQQIDLRVFNSHPSHKNRVGAYLSRLNVGTKDDPEPISMKLVSIDMMLQRKFWERLNKYIMESLCTEKTTVEDIIKKKNLIVQALREYTENIETPKDEKVKVPTVWPEGTYALPKTVSQPYGRSTCPTGVHWDSVQVTWCTDSGKNDWSQSGHFTGRKEREYIYLYFCVKRDNGGYRQVMKWPKGNYCVTKYQGCPNGFLDGYVQWKYTTASHSSCSQSNQYSPDGSAYKGGRDLKFCCRSDGDIDSPIDLPRDTPFYLIRNNKTTGCQQVKGMIANNEYITWDNGNVTVSNYNAFGGSHPMVDKTSEGDVTLHFCYYKKKA